MESNVSDAALVAMVEQIQGSALQINRLFNHLVFRVQFAQSEIIRGQLGSQYQLDISKIGRCGLQRRICRFHISTHASE